ncbi:hypothetical protein AMATHDRAFT_149857 [Amanita thiersii Skay4041]|uniref:Anti-proliferative protein domain-containing protein n=1 Tax=Amanita thiersii Skay4041 TaxID=703135 RepID=A0A2A9NJL6_9AGAR|nr:hypothetical protein AMATHDRAFT_149857 [Amanita thiersii Skay4041]
MSINAPNVASSVVTNGIPKSLIEAICFLTRPLFMLYSPSEVLALQNVLQTTLMTTYLTSRDSTLLLTLSPTSPLPRPLLAACIAANVQWMDWIMLLGNQQIDLLIEPCRVVVRFGGEMGKVTTIWQELKPTPAFLRATVDSARARASGRTKAQELLEVTDKEETEEIFALLSNLTVTGITPTPARDCFSLGQWEKGMPVPISASEDEESPIYIDTSKQSMQKYLYQGGVSTVLTGGVMLGPQKRTQQIPPRMRKYQAFSSIANASGNWRRF